MVKSTSLSLLFLFVAGVSAQGPTITAAYPPPNAIPPTNSPEVIQWLKEIDLTGAPTIPLRQGAPPPCPATPAPDECNWTCQSCPSDDVTFCSAPNTWGLTFDDGPSTATPPLLDYLKTEKLTASFFLIGGNVAQYPEIVKREVAEGHHLASHTWSHHALTSLTNEQIVAEMRWTEKVVFDHTGLRLKYMRPPFGDINNRVRFVLKKLGYIPVDWTGDEFDTNDWRQPEVSKSELVTAFTKSLDTYAAGPKDKGFYCLEHDVDEDTVSLARDLIPLGRARNISFSAVPGCQHDPQPYQVGSNTTLPTGTASLTATVTATATATVTVTTTVSGSSPGRTVSGGATTPTTTVLGKSAASHLSSSYSVAALASIMIVAILLA